MNDESVRLIIEYLDKIGEKLGVSAKTVWPWLVREQYIEAIRPIVLMLICGTVFAISAIITKKNILQGKTTGDITWGVLIVSGLITLGAVVGFFAEIFDILNPEYWALKDLLRQIK